MGEAQNGATLCQFLNVFIGLAKKFLWFFNVKIKDILLSRTLLNNIFTILFHNLLSFLKQFHESTFPNLFIFLSKELFQVPFTDFQETEVFFPLREFYKDWNTWKSEGAVSGEYGGGIRTSQPSCNSFCLGIRETCSLALPWWKIMRGLLIHFRHFLSSAAFSWSNWEQYLLELIIWFSGRSS